MNHLPFVFALDGTFMHLCACSHDVSVMGMVDMSSFLYTVLHVISTVNYWIKD